MYKVERVLHFLRVIQAANGSTPFERGDEAEGFLMITISADEGLVDIQDRRQLALVPEAVREWMKQDESGKESFSSCINKLSPALAHSKFLDPGLKESVWILNLWPLPFLQH